MGKKSSSKAKKDLYSLYKGGNKSLENRTIKLKRHIKNNPDDKQAKRALKDGLVVYRRGTPRNHIWSKQKRTYAILLTKAGLNGHLALAVTKNDKL